MTTWLHDARLKAVLRELEASGARSVLDLGCGAGDFLCRLIELPLVSRITGVEQSPALLSTLGDRLAKMDPGKTQKVRLLQRSLLVPDPAFAGHDAVVMVEVIEHLDPVQLSVLERVLFAAAAAPLVIVTTPNAEFNPLLGVPAHRMRHPDHRFEWTRRRFRAWTEGVAARAGVRVDCADIGGAHPDLGGASQMACFRRSASVG